MVTKITGVKAAEPAAAKFDAAMHLERSVLLSIEDVLRSSCADDHDLLMDLLARQVEDPRVRRLVRLPVTSSALP